MIVLINTNRMVPPIAPIGVDYVAGAARRAGIDTEVLDLCLADDAPGALRTYLAGRSPELVGLSFRNVDDCFWPSAAWFVPALAETVAAVRAACDAPVVLGGVGFSVFAGRIVEHTGADFGIRGDGEQAIVALVEALRRGRRFERVPGLVWREGGRIRRNAPAWPEPLSLPTARDAIDNGRYFRRGGQGGIETKRGCDRRCTYCADPPAKGRRLRLRRPAEVADEVESLLAQGAEVLHLCDGEFNVPVAHARAVCEEFIRRSLGERVRWYTYMAVVPFDAALAGAMRRAGCAGIDFTGDSGCPAMLATYRHRHGREDLAAAVRLCRDHGMAVMIDLLLGGPGETPDTVEQSIRFIQRIDPDCAGAALGIRVYPGTAMAEMVAGEGPAEANAALRRRYDGPVDFFRPTFYISAELGERPAGLVRDLIAGDKRFFEPLDPVAGAGEAGSDYNYNDNTPLVEAIAAGARGAYWHILRRLRDKS